MILNTRWYRVGGRIQLDDQIGGRKGEGVVLRPIRDPGEVEFDFQLDFLVYVTHTLPYVRSDLGKFRLAPALPKRNYIYLILVTDQLSAQILVL